MVAMDLMVLHFFGLTSLSDKWLVAPLSDPMLVYTTQQYYCCNTCLPPILLAAAFAVGTLLRLDGVTGSSTPSEEREMTLYTRRSV